MTDWYVVGSFFCCWVRSDASGVIVGAAPILGRFVGQPIQNLILWRHVESVTPLSSGDAS